MESGKVATPGEGVGSPQHDTTTRLRRDNLQERTIHQEYAVKSKMIDVEGKVQTMWEDLLYNCSHSHPSDVMPMLAWFPKFLRNPLPCVLKDVICGITITAIVVPQGMAYGMLAGLPPVNGLYTAMLPTLGYTIFGTCMHLSIGPFALISMLTAEGINGLVDDPENNPEEAVEAARQLAFFSACMLALLGILRLGFIGTFLSDPVLSGYQTAVSIIIPTSQLKHAFQATVKRANYIETVRQLVERIAEGDINGVSFVIFLVSFALIYVIQMINKKKPCDFLKKFPLPAELIVTVLSTLVCFLADFADTQNVRVTGKIPEGLPKMRMPELGKYPIDKLLPPVAMISLMTYITAMSVSKTFARKFNYEVDNNQELMAFGWSNFLGSFSSCYPAAASLSRTAVVGSSGAATPLHNVWMVVMLGIVLSFCGPLIETLPNAALAAIVVMAFKSLLLGGFEEFKNTWRVSPPDCLMWSIAFWSTLCTDVTMGIAIAVIADIFYLFFKTTRPTYAVMGRLAKSRSIYCNRKHFEEVDPVPGVMIFRFDAPLHFANREVFLGFLMRELRLHDEEMNGGHVCREGIVRTSHFWSHLNELASAFKSGFLTPKKGGEDGEVKRIKAIVLDCSPMNHIDITAARALDKLRMELQNRECRLILAHVKFVCYNMLQKHGLFVSKEGKEEFDVVCFRELHAAVLEGEGKLRENHQTPLSLDNSDREKPGLVKKFTKSLAESFGISKPKPTMKRSTTSWEELSGKGYMGACEDATVVSGEQKYSEMDIEDLVGAIVNAKFQDAQTETAEGELYAEHLPASFATTWRRRPPPEIVQL